jgi:hypothetical protein
VLLLSIAVAAATPEAEKAVLPILVCFKACSYIPPPLNVLTAVDRKDLSG